MRSASASTGYEGQRIALLTRHGKEKVIAPRLAASLQATVERVDGFDTDTLGTFTRDIPRYGSQIDAARRKARIGMDLSGLPYGLASEGSFGADPFAAVVPWNVELVIFIDDVQQIEILGQRQGPARHHHAKVGTGDELAAFATLADFPAHGLVVRPDEDDDRGIRKGITSWSELTAQFESAKRESADGRVFVESDLRAHMNPTRMQMIAAATEDLIRRVASRCPACGTNGFWVGGRIGGLPCADCGTPTAEKTAERYICPKCPHEEYRRCTDLAEADPKHCAMCNP